MKASAARRQLRTWGREQAIATRAYARSAAGRAGGLPDFLIIGAQRSGTTSLFTYLGDHPSIQPSYGKELQFYSLHLDRGTTWYRGNFPRLKPGELTFEASPFYLFHPEVPRRVAAVTPGTKLIVLLRDPATRAYSHYLHNREHGTENLSFLEAIEREGSRVPPADALDDPRAMEAFRRYSYLARGRYAEQLERWYEHFDRSQVAVFRSEELYNDTARTYRAVTDFLGIAPYDHPGFARHNHWADDSVSQLTPEVKDHLQRYFSPLNEQLRELMDWPVTPWSVG